MATVRSILKRLFQVAFYTILLSLPVTIFPVFFGVWGGVEFSRWSHRQIASGVDSFLREVERESSLSYYNVPGAPTMRQWKDNKAPFFIPRLDSRTWANKMGMMKPQREDWEGINLMGTLDDLVIRDKGPREVWVYVTWLAEFSSNEWDVGFSQMLQEIYKRPLSTNKLFMLDCIDSRFLCDIWGVQQHTLVHFHAENFTLADPAAEGDARLDLDYGRPCEDLVPVTASVVELPLKGEEAVALLPRNRLATAEMQLRNVLRAPKTAVLEIFDEWSPAVQMMRRFQDLADGWHERPGTWWYTLHKADRWWTSNILEKVFGKDLDDNFMIVVQTIVFTVSILLTELLRLPFGFMWELYTWFMGLTWDGEPMGTHVWPEDNGGTGGMWDDMFGAFLEQVGAKVGSQASEAAAKAAVTSSTS